jgi:hypothetical protein
MAMPVVLASAQGDRVASSAPAPLERRHTLARKMTGAMTGARA